MNIWCELRQDDFVRCRGNVVALSREKVASNVVQKSFEYASPGVLYCLMNEVIYGRVVSR